MWQDWVMSIGQWLFIIALLPTIFSSNKPPLLTSILTAIVLSSFVVALSSLGLIISAISTGLTCVCWIIIAVQTLMRRR